MASKDKDRIQKRMALEFCVQQGILPYMEVPIVESVQFQRSPILVTDLDVLGLSLNWNGNIHRTLFDCKTTKDSPINRAVWCAGIVEHVGLDEAYVILKRSALPTHKFTADKKDIYLFNSESFEQFMTFHGFDPSITTSYLSDLVALDTAQEFISSNPVFASAYQAAVHRAPIEPDSAKAMRLIVAKLGDIARELDPNKAGHRYIVAELASAFSIHLQVAVSKLIRMVGAQSARSQLEDVVKYYMWGGFDNFHAKQKMQQLVLQTEDEQLALPAWNSFLKLIGVLIASVNSLRRVPVAGRTIGIRSVSGKMDEYERYTQRLVFADKKVPYALMQIVRYLQEATRFPQDFIRVFDGELEALNRAS